MLRRFFFVAGALGALVVACQLVAGIDDHHFTAPAPSIDAQVLDAVVVPPTCHESPVPEKPTSESPSTGDVQLVFALDSLSLPDVTHPYGFDLDGVCTCSKNDPSKNGGQTSCTLPANAPPDSGCDYEGGVDDSFAGLISQLELLAPKGQDLESLENKNIFCGSLNVLFIIDRYNGGADDADVGITAIRSAGIYEVPDPDAGPKVDASVCGVTGFSSTIPRSEPYPSSSDGTDRWALDSLDLRNYDAGLLANHSDGYVSGGQLVVDATGFGFVLPISFGSEVFSIATPVVTAQIGKDENGLWRLRNGVIGGRASSQDVITAFTNAFSEGQGTDCDASAGLAGFIEPLICASRDIPYSAAADFTDRPCDGLSLGLAFTGVAAIIDGEPVDKPTVNCPPPPGCSP